MRRIGQILHLDTRDDFSAGDHGEYVESGVRDILLISAAMILLLGAFVASLF